MKNKKIIFFLIVANIILIIVLCSLINGKGNIIKETQLIKEMSESTQVTDLNNQINSLNTEHTMYMNYIQTCKTKIATALTNEGVATSDQAKLETMAENISKVLQARTNKATATADNITQGKTAWVNGKLITGNGTDNNNYYSLGKSNSGKSGVIKSVPYQWVNVELGFKPKSVVIGIELLASIYYDENTSSTTWLYATGDCGWYNLGSMCGIIGFDLTDSGFKILYNSNQSLSFYYVAI